jgi:hypothetical protein
MTKYFLAIGLALLWGAPFAGQAQAGDPGCCGNASCESGCGNGCGGCHHCDRCCPQCGCKLVPVCHVYWDTKKITKYEYTCKCETICVPKVSCCGDKCGGCGQCADGCKEGCQGSCNNACNNGGDGCGSGCCKCCIHEVKKLVKVPCVKEECVRKCSVTWTCPKCGGCCGEGNCCGSEANAAPVAAPAAPAQVSPAPAPAPKMPPPPKTTNYAPRSSEFGS